MKDNSFEELKAAIEAGITQQQDNFSRNELLGRGLFASFLKDKGVTDYKFTEGKFDSVDGFFVGADQKKWEVEIKVRNDSADQYSKLFFELSKLKAMCLLIQQGQAEEGLYINFIRNKLYIYNIRSVCQALKKKQIQIVTDYANRTTAAPSDKVYKKMILLPQKMAEIYEYIEGRWAKVQP